MVRCERQDCLTCSKEWKASVYPYIDLEEYYILVDINGDPIQPPAQRVLTIEEKPTKATPISAFTDIRPCLCGCGQEVRSKNPNTLFVPGHDSKLKSLLKKIIKGEAVPSAIPTLAAKHPFVVKFFQENNYASAAL